MKIKRTCVVCAKDFERRLDNYAIALGKMITCGVICARISNGLKKRKGVYKICTTCGSSFYTKRSENGQYCKRSCFQNVGGKCVSLDGYYLVRTPNGQMKEHRWIMMQYLGRPLNSQEIVHHINGDKLDNRLENLQLTTRAKHNSLHHKGKKKGKKRVP